MTLFNIIWAIDALTIFIVLCFFFIGIADGTVTGANLRFWTLVIASLVMMLFGSFWLWPNGYEELAMSLVLILATPALFFTTYLSVAIFVKPRWV